jgi:hypothetical protein
MAQPRSEFRRTSHSNGQVRHDPSQFQQHQAALLAQMRTQIEFYFSPQNLATDQYLLSQLQSPAHIGAAPIEVIASFPKVRELHALARIGRHLPTSVAPPADPRLIIMALEGSSIVSVSDDGRWIIPSRKIPFRPPQPLPSYTTDVPFESALVKEDHGASATVATTSTASSAPSSPSSQTSSLGVPTYPLPLKERNTIIVRDVPEGANAHQVTEAFSTDVVVPKSVRPDIGNTWYVDFDSEAQAVAALSATRERTIAGAPVRGRLKNELAVPTSATSGRSGSSTTRQVKNVAPQAPLIPIVKVSNLALPALRPDRVQHQQPQYARPYYYHPSVPLPPYGYVPYPYAMDMAAFHYHQLAMGFQQQQQYQQAYGVPVANPQRNQNEESNQQTQAAEHDGYVHPPPHVFVPPKQQRNAKKKKQHKAKKAKSESQDLQMTHSSGAESGVSEQSADQSLDRGNLIGVATTTSNSSNSNNHSTANPENNSSGLGKKAHTKNRNNNKKNDKRKVDATSSQDSPPTTKTLNVEDFPALGGEKALLKRQPAPSKGQSERQAYAQALLKSVKASPPSRNKDAAPATKQIEGAMANMGLSNTVSNTSDAAEGC